MQNKQNPERKALLVGTYMHDCSLTIAKNELPRLNCTETVFEHGVPAGQAIKSDRYHFILLPCRVAPGLEVETTRL